MMTDDTFLTQLLSLPSVERAELSPDRRWVAFAWYRVSRNIDIFVAPTDGSAAPTALTDTPEETRLIGWAADSRGLIVAEDHDGDERVRLFRVRLDAPGVMEPLTEDAPAAFIYGGEISPDGRTLFYAMNQDVATGALIEPSWLYRHDLDSGERTPIARPARPCWDVPRLNAAGTQLIYTRKDRSAAGEQVYLVDVEGGDDREILSAGDDLKVAADWLPDSRRILVVAEAGGGSYKRVGLYDTASGAASWLIDDPARQIEAASVTRDGLIVVDEVRDGRHAPSVIDLGSDIPAETPFPRPARGNLLPLGRAADGAWLALSYSSTEPTDIVRLDTTGGRTSLTRWQERAAIDLGQLTPAEDFRWASDDGTPIHGWLYRARAASGRAVLFIHGGPTWHSEDWINAQIQYLASQGFHVLDVNYRGSTGYGMAFRESIKADGWGGREQQDIAAGARALIAAGLAAPGKIGVTGTSYGGYSSWCQIVHTPPELIAAAAPICGMTDLVIDYETTRPDLRPYSEEMIGGTPASAPERYRERSPVHFVAQIRGRLLIVQGAQDPNVTPENVRQVVRHLEASGVRYELLEFADEGHGIHRPANQAVLYKSLALFFRSALA
ncbi:prolyl oligopeptidase family serine peptidase [Oscillochloris sp. ZM17-4]|uniref:alpha/beta hydrolase family protein n=1 Tax=Oscillochloris sp. ZM17-4 TaxID=2866714 RepID=UPI001C72FFA5|nr:prolyl oligopeptidase family serine peptidase [Oscillochloris sp. ZM17-4]MBX0326715.1 prolyl oligopeptidase family serine peptidase [Oscillochloris sp. ZM17-4]